MVRRKTHKKGRGGRSSSALSVEGLHAAFEKLDRKVVAAIRGGASDTTLADTIDRAWSGLFQHRLSGAAARGLVHHYRAVHGGRSGRRHTRGRPRQRGGMAPINWTLGQGSTAAVYGRFPVEMGVAPKAVAALDLGRFYESQVGRACDSTGGAPAPGQAGGGLFDALTMGHAPDSVPQNPVAGTVRAIQGEMRPFGPLADPVRAAVPLQMPDPKPFDTTAVSSLSSLGQIYSPF
jgi:hypothetical protein